MTLRDIPAVHFPFRHETFSQMHTALNDAARRFQDLGYPDLSEKVAEARAKLHEAWDAIVAAEQAGR
jgi:hypothetical protein